MALDPRFVVTSDLEEYFVNKDDGTPLAGGIVTFYSDINRTVKKPVYQITGSPPNYTYAVLPNPCVLSDVGTFQDALGNNIVPYYFPYQGTPNDNTSVLELYYITVQSSGLVPQFTRQGWPNTTTDSNTPSTTLGSKNFIPNGQFLSHNDIVSATEPPVTTIPFGIINLSSQAIAQGGWSFRRSTAGTSVFNNSFVTAPVSGGFGLKDFPRFAFNFICTSFNASDQYRDLTISWPNVNTFSSGATPGTQDYTFFFNATSNDGFSYAFDIYLIFYFGTGGSPSTPITTLLSTQTIGNGYASYNINIVGFPPSGSNIIGTNNDDYVAIAIRGPASGWSVQLTDFALVMGNVTLSAFPIQTNAEQLDEGVAGWMPTPAANGNDLYLPLVLTTTGMTFDHSQVGTIVSTTRSAVNNELFCDGSTYLTSAYSSIGIPYSRLQSILFSNILNAPLFGTGLNFAQVNVNSGATSQIIVGTNKAGVQTNPTDGTTTTGFAFTTTAPLSNAGAATYNYKCYANGNSVVTFISTFSNGTNGNAGFAGGTSGMSFQNYGDALSGPLFSATVSCLSAATLAAGSGNPALYFTFSNNSTNYYVWFYINGETDPAPGGTGIRCNLISTMGTQDVANILARVISGEQTNAITVGAASTVAAGSWFNFYANAIEYSVWYKKAGLPATAPTLPGTAIQATLTGSETAAQVATATQIAINSYQFAIPNLQGVFLRGSDSNGPLWDIDAAKRWSYDNLTSGGLVGTFEFQNYQVHNHPGSTANVKTITTLVSGAATSGYNASIGATSNILSIASDGTTETRPVNVAVNYFIKY